MKYVGYILKTKLFYISIAVYSMLCIAFLLCFQQIGARTIDAAATFDKFTSTMIAYDPFCEESDSYADYSDSVIISLRNEEGESLNLRALQFLEKCQYTDYSIVNCKTVCAGKYSVLQKGEIAIPKSMASEYSLNINQHLYVDGQECVIKYLFEDIYQITAVDFSVKQTVAFLGVDTVDESKVVGYCNFNPSETMHQQIKSLTAVRKELSNRRVTLLVGESIVLLLTAFLVQIFRQKKEMLSLRRNRRSGEKNVLLDVFLIEITYTLPTVIIVFAVCRLLAINQLILFAGIGTMSVAFLIYMLITMAKVRR